MSGQSRNAPVRSYLDLIVWQRALDLAENVYEATRKFPKEEIYGITSQMRRAAVSVPANIAEGMARNSTKELLQFLVVARGSLSELDTHLVLSRELGFANSTKEVEDQLDRVFGLIGGLINSHRKSSGQG